MQIGRKLSNALRIGSNDKRELTCNSNHHYPQRTASTTSPLLRANTSTSSLSVAVSLVPASPSTPPLVVVRLPSSKKPTSPVAPAANPPSLFMVVSATCLTLTSPSSVKHSSNVACCSKTPPISFTPSVLSYPIIKATVTLSAYPLPPQVVSAWAPSS